MKKNKLDKETLIRVIPNINKGRGMKGRGRFWGESIKKQKMKCKIEKEVPF